MRRSPARVLCLLFVAATSLVIFLPGRPADASIQPRTPRVAGKPSMQPVAGWLGFAMTDCPMPVASITSSDPMPVTPQRSAVERASLIEAQRAAMPCYNPLDQPVR